MRKLIDIITEAELVEMAMDSSALQQMISRALDNDATYIANLHGAVGDDLLSATIEAVKASGADPKVIHLGHSMVGKELPNNLFSGGVVILDIAPHNLAMSLGEKGLYNLEMQILDAEHGYPCSIILVQTAPSQFSSKVRDLFPEYGYSGRQVRDIEDGGTHRVV